MGSLVFSWLATLHVAEGLILHDRYSPFQPRPFYELHLFVSTQAEYQGRAPAGLVVRCWISASLRSLLYVREVSKPISSLVDASTEYSPVVLMQQIGQRYRLERAGQVSD